MEALNGGWLEQGAAIEAMADGPAKDAAVKTHWTLHDTIRDNHPEPKQAKFEPQLLSTEAALLAAREIENKRRKDDADKCMARFKALAGPTITSDLTKVWDDPSTKSTDKARISFDHFLQCQHTDAESTVARLTADMNALHPATTVHGGLLLYQKMSTIQETLTKIGLEYAMAESVLVATIRTKLQGDAFDNLKFFHKQADGNSRPVVRAASLFGTPAPARPATSQVSWTQLGTKLIELSETKTTASSSCLESQALACTQEESIAMYASQQYQSRYPPPPSHHQQSHRNFVPATGPPPWLGHSRPFQNLVQPLTYNMGAGRATTPYSQFLHAHQQQQAAGSKLGVRSTPAPGPTGATGPGKVNPDAHGGRRFPQGAQASGRSHPRQSRPPIPVYSRGGEIRCYMAQEDDDDGGSYPMQQEQCPEADSGGAAPENTATAFSVQEYHMQQQQPTQAPYYVDEYGQVHYLG